MKSHPSRFATLALILVVGWSAGCVVTRTTELTYTPRAIQELQRVGPCKVHIEVVDGRPLEERQWVAAVAKVRFVTQPETLALLHESLAAGLRYNGLVVVDAAPAADVLIRIRLTRFWHEMKDHSTTLERIMWVNAEAEVARPGAPAAPNRIPVNGYYSRTIPLMAVGTVKPGFEAALADAVDQLLIDQRFIQALPASVRSRVGF